MASWQVIYTKDEIKDMEKAFAAGFHSKILCLIERSSAVGLITNEHKTAGRPEPSPAVLLCDAFAAG